MKRRLIAIAMLAGAAFIGVAQAGPWPRDQHVEYVVGPERSHLRQLDASWAPVGEHDDWSREVSFRYPSGAPPVVTYEPRLANGDYTVELRLVDDAGQTRVLRRRVSLTGGTASVYLSANP